VTELFQALKAGGYEAVPTPVLSVREAGEILNKLIKISGGARYDQ
jgi:hypothetical protein